MKRIITFIAIIASAVISQTVKAADTYELDAGHATVGFKMSHLVISEVGGRFNDFEGTVTVDPDANNAVTGAEATIQAKSIDTGVPGRDEHLRNADFFDVEKFPTITFESKKVETKGNQHVMIGDFTMHGVKKEIRLPFTVKGPIKDPWGKARIGIKAEITINRKDYGLGWNKVMEAGGLTVGEEVHIEINAEAVKK